MRSKLRFEVREGETPATPYKRGGKGIFLSHFQVTWPGMRETNYWRASPSASIIEASLHWQSITGDFAFV